MKCIDKQNSAIDNHLFRVIDKSRSHQHSSVSSSQPKFQPNQIEAIDAMDDNVEHTLSQFDLANGALKTLDPPADFDGPVKKRRITDPLFFLLILGAWGVSSWIGVYSLQNGNYNRVVHPVDYKGRVCGVDKDSSGQILPSFWHPVDNSSNGVCVVECPIQNNFQPNSQNELICRDNEDLLSMDGCSIAGVLSSDVSALIACGGCMFKTESKVLNDFCVPTDVSSVVEKVNEAYVSQGVSLSNWSTFKYSTYMQRLARDVRTAFTIVSGVGIGGSVFLGIIFLILSIFPKGVAPMIWGSALLTPCALGGCGTYLFFLANKYSIDQSGMHTTAEAYTVLIASYVLWSVAGLILCTVLIMRQDITKTILVAKAVTRSIKEITFSSVLAIVQMVLYLVTVGAFGFWVVLLSTTADKDYSVLTHYMFAFLIFSLLWTSEFITALGKIALSNAYAGWYFTPEKEEGHDVSVFKSTMASITFHAGTAAFGSLFIKFVTLLRSPILLLQSCIKRSGMDNICADAVICCCQCNLFILERFLKFMSKKAYTHSAIFGTSFCKSSHESYYLKLRNNDVFEDAGPFSLFSVFYTRLFIVSTVSVSSYALLDTFYSENLFSILSVTGVIVMISYYISEIFTDVLGEAVSTSMYCYIADEEIMGGEGAQFVYPELDECLEKIYTSNSRKLAIGGVSSERYDVDVPKAVDVV